MDDPLLLPLLMGVRERRRDIMSKLFSLQRKHASHISLALIKFENDVFDAVTIVLLCTFVQQRGTARHHQQALLSGVITLDRLRLADTLGCH